MKDSFYSTFHWLTFKGSGHNYLNGFSSGVRKTIGYFIFDGQIRKLEEYDLLYLVVKRFVDRDANQVFKSSSSIEMGYVFEELIRKFAELSNEIAGKHFTPREVIRLTVNLLFADDKTILTTPGIAKTIYDSACGTGGMLAVAEDYAKELNADADSGREAFSNRVAGAINTPRQLTGKHPVVDLVAKNRFQPLADAPKDRRNKLFSERIIGLIGYIHIHQPESALGINDECSFTSARAAPR